LDFDDSETEEKMKIGVEIDLKEIRFDDWWWMKMA
jgi:hypothetical protein